MMTPVRKENGIMAAAAVYLRNADVKLVLRALKGWEVDTEDPVYQDLMARLEDRVLNMDDTRWSTSKMDVWSKMTNAFARHADDEGWLARRDLLQATNLPAALANEALNEHREQLEIRFGKGGAHLRLLAT
jgi:hypothetical protein